MSRHIFIVGICLLVTVVLSAGCTKVDPRAKGLVPVGGVILYNGTPVEDAAIILHREGGDTQIQGGSAISGKDGKFAINMFRKGDGTFPGDYIVTVAKETVEYPISNEEMMRLEQEGKSLPAGKIISHLPKKYEDKEKSGLVITVPKKGVKDLKIELEGKM